MSGFESAPWELGPGKLLCPACGQETEFNYADGGKLVHKGGSALCTTPEPKGLAPAALWPNAASRIPYLSGGDPALAGILRTPAQVPKSAEERRRGLAEARLLAGVEPFEDRERRPFLILYVLVAIFLGMLALCGGLVYMNWPTR